MNQSLIFCHTIIICFGQLGHAPLLDPVGKMDVTILATVLMAVAAYFLTDSLIGSSTIRDSFIKGNLFGRDMNKTSGDKVYGF